MRLRDLVLTRRHAAISAAIALGMVVLLVNGTAPSPQVGANGHPEDQPGRLDLSKLPLAFEPNAGQTDPAVRYVAHAPGAIMYFAPAEVVLAVARTGDKSGAPSPEDRADGADPAANAWAARPRPWLRHPVRAQRAGGRAHDGPDELHRRQHAGAYRRSRGAGGESELLHRPGPGPVAHQPAHIRGRDLQGAIRRHRLELRGQRWDAEGHLHGSRGRGSRPDSLAVSGRPEGLGGRGGQSASRGRGSGRNGRPADVDRAGARGLAGDRRAAQRGARGIRGAAGRDRGLHGGQL